MEIEVKYLDPRLTDGTFDELDYQSEGAAAIDVVACIDEPMTINAGDTPTLIKTGLAINIDDPNYAALLMPRSSSHKKGLILGNSIGLIDSDYQGEIFVSAWNRKPAHKNVGSSVMAKGYAESRVVIEPGERIAQLMFVPVARVKQKVVEEFSTESKRGTKGFGSTDKKKKAS